MVVQFEEVVTRAQRRFRLDLDGVHGWAHWQRVRENGAELAGHNGADQDIVRLFSVLHDCCRENDGWDPEHGPRAAEFTESLRPGLIEASDGEFAILLTAIRGHTESIHTADLTIGTCWDADRLDIGRVGKQPDRRFLNTAVAKREGMIRWAYERSIGLSGGASPGGHRRAGGSGVQ